MAEEPRDIAREIHALTVLAARRCAYDLKHAAQDLGGPAGDLYLERAGMWLDIFNPTDGPKQYRHSLHNEIFHLECQVDRLKKLLEDNGIEDPDDPDKIPF